MKTGSLLAIILLSLVALAHLLRLLTQSEITLNGALVPMWASILGVVIPGGIALLLLRER